MIKMKEKYKPYQKAMAVAFGYGPKVASIWERSLKLEIRLWECVGNFANC